MLLSSALGVQQCYSFCITGLHRKFALTAVRAHVDLERAGAGAALVALGKRADAFIGVGVLGFVLWRGGGRGGLLLPAGAVVHEVGLQVPLAAVPDPTVFTGKNVLWWPAKHKHTVS